MNIFPGDKITVNNPFKDVIQEGEVPMNCRIGARLVGEDVCGNDGKVIKVEGVLCQEHSCPFRERETGK